MDDSELQQLNVEIAERVMGWTRDPKRRGPLSDWHEPKCKGKGRCAPNCGFELPSYSHKIASTMTIVEKMRDQGWSFACTWYKGKLPYASFCKGTAASSKNAEAETLPLAICKAALKAAEGMK